MEAVPITQLVNSTVSGAAGEPAGTIEELIIDPVAGIVRFARLKTAQDREILIPWAAMTYLKSSRGYVLTHLGETLVDS